MSDDTEFDPRWWPGNEPRKPYLVTLTATVKTQVAVTARDSVQAWLLGEEQAADNPPPLPDGMTYVPDAFGRPWTATQHSGDVVEILHPTAGDTAAGAA